MKNLLMILTLVLVSTVSLAQVTVTKDVPKEVKSLEEMLLPLVEKAINGMETAGEFIMEQAPELLQEFYAWHTALAIVGMVSGFLLIIGGIFGVVIETRRYNWDIVFLGAFGGIVPLLVGIVMFIVNLYQYLFITIAPKLYLIEYFL